MTQLYVWKLQDNRPKSTAINRKIQLDEEVQNQYQVVFKK
jgi:hypothetical protein